MIERVIEDVRAERNAEGEWPPGHHGFSPALTRRFETDPLHLLLECYERFGPVFTLRLLYARVVIALGPEANHYITVSHANNFRWRDGGMGDLIPLLGDGLLTTDGDYHRRARKVMLPAFHRDAIMAAERTMCEEIEPAVARLEDGMRLDLYAWTRRLALRVAMRALFGMDPDRSAREADLAEDFETALGFWGKRYVLQMLRGPGSPWRRMNEARARIDAVLFAEIARRRAEGELGSDILGLLLAAEDDEGHGFGPQELRDQLMTLLFAGHDTTTSTVAFLFYELGRNPGELERLEQDPGRMELVIDETLRMYPPAWIGPRRSVEPFELCGAQVPGGVLVNYVSWASHHLADVFPEPFEFRPDRFTEEERAKLPKGAYVPFGGGSRTCIGMRFGQLEIKAIASTILQRFRLEPADGRPVSIRQMPTLSPIGGLPVTVRAR